jgi:hypothetical protein
VPHVNDARARAECAQLLGGPAKLERAARSGSGRMIDTSSQAQQEFQALLLWSLLSPRRSLRWDAGKGRAFRDLHCYYTWVSPQPGYLAMGWTVAPRVARYLLPDLRCDDDGRARCSGIPGLRLAGIAKGSIQLVHLSTGGVLELHDNCRFRPEIMTGSLRWETCQSPEDECGYDAGERLWQRPELDEAETADLAQWTLARQAPALSAVMARIHVLWRHWSNGAELDISPATGLPRLSWWAGPGTGELARLLVASPIEANGAQWMHGPEHSLVITLDGSRLELRGPARDWALDVRSAEFRTYHQRCSDFSAIRDQQAVPV